MEVISRDSMALAALGSRWDPRRLMLFLVSLADRGVPDGAYLLSKLYSRGLIMNTTNNGE